MISFDAPLGTDWIKICKLINVISRALRVDKVGIQLFHPGKMEMETILQLGLHSSVKGRSLLEARMFNCFTVDVTCNHTILREKTHNQRVPSIRYGTAQSKTRPFESLSSPQKAKFLFDISKGKAVLDGWMDGWMNGWALFKSEVDVPWKLESTGLAWWPKFRLVVELSWLPATQMIERNG